MSLPRHASSALLATVVSLGITLASGCTQPKCNGDLVWDGKSCIAVTDETGDPQMGSDAGEPGADVGTDDDMVDPPDPDDGMDEDGSDDDGPESGLDAGPDAGPDAEVDAGDDGGVGACAACPLHSECVDDACKCLAGFVEFAGACADENECDDGSGTNPCGEFGTCENTVGSYACTCDEGLRLVEGEAQTCVDVDECGDDAEACGVGSCVNTTPSYHCECPAGYAGTNTQSCSDINECDTNNGGCGVAPCENTPGAFACGDCPLGFLGSAGQCTWNDARLDALQVSDAPLSPVFAADKAAYVAQASAATESVVFTPTLPTEGLGRATITVDSEPVESGASSNVRELALGDNAFQVEVLAESGASRTYHALVRRGWTHRTHVKASNTGSGDGFGFSIAVSADGLTMAVGAPQEDSANPGIDGDQSDDSAPNTGAVYVYRREPNGWAQDEYIKASNAQKDDRFGQSVSLSADGKTLVVGATQEDGKGTNVDSGLQDDNSITDAGAAYVFERSDSGWAQTAYLKAANPGWTYFPFRTGYKFGNELRISGDGNTIAVSSSVEAGKSQGVGGSQEQDTLNYIYAGAVYMFRRSGTTWVPEAYIKSMEPRPNANFGDALALSHDGSLLVVGEPNEINDTGALYTYSRQDQTWSFESKTRASNAGAKDGFGLRLSMSPDGSTLLVGAPAEDSNARGLAATPEQQTDNTAAGAGAAYLFERVGTSWEQQLYIKASNALASGAFGRSLALSSDGQTFAVGAPGEKGSSALGGDQAQPTSGSLGANTGAVYLFRKQGDAWSQIAYVKSPRPRAGHKFGDHVAMDATGACLAVGVEFDSSGARGVNGDLSVPDMSGSGAAFLYE